MSIFSDLHELSVINKLVLVLKRIQGMVSIFTFREFCNSIEASILSVCRISFSSANQESEGSHTGSSI